MSTLTLQDYINRIRGVPPGGVDQLSLANYQPSLNMGVQARLQSAPPPQSPFDPNQPLLRPALPPLQWNMGDSAPADGSQQPGAPPPTTESTPTAMTAAKQKGLPTWAKAFLITAGLSALRSSQGGSTAPLSALTGLGSGYLQKQASDTAEAQKAAELQSLAEYRRGMIGNTAAKLSDVNDQKFATGLAKAQSDLGKGILTPAGYNQAVRALAPLSSKPIDPYIVPEDGPSMLGAKTTSDINATTVKSDVAEGGLAVKKGSLQARQTKESADDLGKIWPLYTKEGADPAQLMAQLAEHDKIYGDTTVQQMDAAGLLDPKTHLPRFRPGSLMESTVAERLQRARREGVQADDQSDMDQSLMDLRGRMGDYYDSVAGVNTVKAKDMPANDAADQFGHYATGNAALQNADTAHQRLGLDAAKWNSAETHLTEKSYNGLIAEKGKNAQKITSARYALGGTAVDSAGNKITLDPATKQAYQDQLMHYQERNAEIDRTLEAQKKDRPALGGGPVGPHGEAVYALPPLAVQLPSGAPSPAAPPAAGQRWKTGLPGIEVDFATGMIYKNGAPTGQYYNRRK